MLAAFYRFYSAHVTAIWLMAGFLFSGAMSTMPPLPQPCNWFVLWAHDYLQWFAANWNKRGSCDPQPKQRTE